MRKLLIVSLLLNVLLAAGYLSRRETAGAFAAGGSGGGATPSTNGDVNCDGALDISDAVSILGFLFLGSPAPCSCECATVPICGNGSLEFPEVCDDGNTADGDGCSSTCQSESACGDGVIEGTEQCDGANLNGHTCQELGFTGGSLACGSNCEIDTSGCTSQVCGDGIVQFPETCDDFNTSNGDGCSATCQVEPGFNCAGSPSTCSTTCGDFIVAGAEECDDGNFADGDGCSAACRRE